MQNTRKPNISACMIVKNEEEFLPNCLNSIKDAVDEIIIVDTGSKDGTREILEELESRYSNLRIFDHPFDGYGPSRNYSLEKANCKYVLVLDADELLTQTQPINDWKIIHKKIKKGNFERLLFGVQNVCFKGESVIYGLHPERLFVNSSKLKFENLAGEYLNIRGGQKVNVKIKHFLPRARAKNLKNDDWYSSQFSPGYIELIGNKAPSEIESFAEWKEYNPKRDLFK